MSRGINLFKRSPILDLHWFRHRAAADGDRHSNCDRQITGRLSRQRSEKELAGRAAYSGTRSVPRGEESVWRSARAVGYHHARLAGTRSAFNYTRPQLSRFSWSTRPTVQADSPAKSNRQHQLDSQEISSSTAEDARDLLTFSASAVLDAVWPESEAQA